MHSVSRDDNLIPQPRAFSIRKTKCALPQKQSRLTRRANEVSPRQHEQRRDWQRRRRRRRRLVAIKALQKSLRPFSESTVWVTFDLLCISNSGSTSATMTRHPLFCQSTLGFESSFVSLSMHSYRWQWTKPIKEKMQQKSIMRRSQFVDSLVIEFVWANQYAVKLVSNFAKLEVYAAQSFWIFERHRKKSLAQQRCSRR